MTRIVFVNRFYLPDQSATARMLAGIATGLAARGEEVCVLTSTLVNQTAGRAPAMEMIDGVQVHRVGGLGLGRSGLGSRLLDYLSFHHLAARQARRLLARNDVLVVKTDPPMLAVTMNRVARARGAVQVNWVQDLFPEIAAAAGVPGLSGGLGRRLGRWRDRAMSEAFTNVVLSESMVERLRMRGNAGTRLEVIPNFADGRLVQARPPRAREDGSPPCVLYAGNLGRVHEFETLLGAAQRIDAAHVHWRIVGQGAQRRALEDAVHARGLRSVTLASPVAEAELPDLLCSADVHLVTLSPRFEGLVVPSKLYGALASGRPVVYVGGAGSESARLLESHGAGVGVRSGDVDGLVDAVSRLTADAPMRERMGRNARVLFERCFGVAQAVDRWAALLEEAAASGRS